MPFFLVVPVHAGSSQAPKPLPFAFQASKAYGDPDQCEDRPFDQAELRDKDGKPFKKSDAGRAQNRRVELVKR
jgi:hypothetical protein